MNTTPHPGPLPQGARETTIPPPLPKLRPCPDCGKEISVRAAVCPQCGCPIAAVLPGRGTMPLPMPPQGGTTYGPTPVVIVKPKKEMGPFAEMMVWGVIIISVIGIGLMILSVVMMDDQQNAKTFSKSWYHKAGGERVEVLEHGRHQFSDGVWREGVKVKWASGGADWIERTAFDRMYEQK